MRKLAAGVYAVPRDSLCHAGASRLAGICTRGNQKMPDASTQTISKRCAPIYPMKNMWRQNDADLGKVKVRGADDPRARHTDALQKTLRLYRCYAQVKIAQELLSMRFSDIAPADSGFDIASFAQVLTNAAAEVFHVYQRPFEEMMTNAYDVLEERHTGVAARVETLEYDMFDVAKDHKKCNQSVKAIKNGLNNLKEHAIPGMKRAFDEDLQKERDELNAVRDELFRVSHTQWNDLDALDGLEKRAKTSVDFRRARMETREQLILPPSLVEDSAARERLEQLALSPPPATRQPAQKFF